MSQRGENYQGEYVHWGEKSLKENELGGLRGEGIVRQHILCV